MPQTLTKSQNKTFEKTDVQQLVTDTIIQQLEQGTIPWQRPWYEENSPLIGLPFNTATGLQYRGINILLLWCAALKDNYHSNEWGTFNHWSKKGEYLKKGEKFKHFVIKYEKVEKEVDGEKKEYSYLKRHYVFNRSQLQSWNPDEQGQPAKIRDNDLIVRSIPLDTFIENTKALIESHDGGAFYRPKDDKILMPHSKNFVDTQTCTAFEGFYSTILHELTHWSGATHRLNRTVGKKFGDYEYAFEELTAEFGAAFMCAGFGISTLDKGDHAAYIDNWLKVLRNDKDFVVKAASEASKAVDYLKGLQPN